MFINIDEIKLNYEIYGNGTPILFLHGWGGQIDSFKPQIDFFSQKYKVIVIDFPGFGKSSMPQVSWGVPEYMEFTKKFIDSLNLKKVNIVAHSFGARVTIMLAEKYPQLIDKIVLTGAAGLKPKRKLRYYIKVYTYKFMKFIIRSEKAKEKLRKKYGSEDYKMLNDNMKKVFVNIVNLDLKPCLRNIKSPTLLIWGRNDTATPTYMGEIMEKEIKDAGLVILENTGHFAYLEKSADFCKIVDTFFKQN